MATDAPVSKKKNKVKVEDAEVVVPKSAAELQRLKLEKLMKNPDKPVVIPEKNKEYKPKEPPEFIRNIWGSSAGAGSGEFHVYRGIRRREYARQKLTSEKHERDQQNEAYQKKLEENQRQADERTAKKRAKRLKKKNKLKAKKAKKEEKKDEGKDESEEEEEDEEDEEKEDDAEENSFIMGGR